MPAPQPVVWGVLYNTDGSTAFQLGTNAVKVELTTIALNNKLKFTQVQTISLSTVQFADMIKAVQLWLHEIVLGRQGFPLGVDALVKANLTDGIAQVPTFITGGDGTTPWEATFSVDRASSTVTVSFTPASLNVLITPATMLRTLTEVNRWIKRGFILFVGGIE